MKVLLLALGSVVLLPINAAMAGAIQVPEPATLSLLAIGVAGALVATRFRKRK